MHKSTRSKKIPTMVAVTIVGEDDAMYRALNKAIQRENRKRIARGEEPVQYIVNYSSSRIDSELAHVSEKVAGALLDGLKKTKIKNASSAHIPSRQ